MWRRKSRGDVFWNRASLAKVSISSDVMIFELSVCDVAAITWNMASLLDFRGGSKWTWGRPANDAL